MSDELKPCPFCGSEAVHTERSYFRDVLIYCENCDAYFTVDSFAADKDDIVEAWNRRAEPERKKGKWEHDGSQWENRWLCSECGYKWFFRKEEAKFCPNCGRRLDG